MGSEAEKVRLTQNPITSRASRNAVISQPYSTVLAIITLITVMKNSIFKLQIKQQKISSPSNTNIQIN